MKHSNIVNSLTENKNFLKKIYDNFKSISADKLKVYLSDFFKENPTEYRNVVNPLSDPTLEDKAIRDFKAYLTDKYAKNRDAALTEVESFRTEMISEVEKEEIDLSNIQVHDTLNPKFFDKDEKLYPLTRKAMLKIAVKFLEFLELDNPIVDDIVFTGSLANKNYNETSDVDIHILMDYSKLGTNKDLLFDYFKTKKNEWADKYNIKIHGAPVELFVQDIGQDKEWTAIYSLLDDKWVQKADLNPNQIDREVIVNKALEIVTKIEDLEGLYESGGNDNEILSQIDELMTSIKKMRENGLKSGGELSNDNLVFKVIRNGGFFDRIADLKKKLIDKEYSLDEVLAKK